MQENGKIVVGTKIDTKGIDEGLKEIDKKVTAHDVSQSFNKGLGKVKGVIKNLASSIAGIFSKGLSVVGGVVKGIIGTIGSILTVVKVTIASIGKAMLKITLASMGMSATLGVVGLVAGILVKAFKKVGEENKELISNIKYLVYVIGEALAPVSNAVANMISQSIKNIINLLAKVITYVAYIINAWFGINILAGVSKDAFMAMQKATDGTADNIGKASKNAKDLKKQLAGFDEMNILQDNSSTGGASGGGIGDVGGIGDMTMPTLELGGEVPEWIKWIADNKDLVIGALAGIVAGLIAMKLELGALMSLGIGLIIAGIVLLIQDIIKFVNDPTWDNFANILRDISIILAGIALVMIAIDAANPVGWIVLAVAAVVALVAVIIKNWDKIKEVLGEVGNWIKTNIIDPVVEFFVGLWNKIVEIFSPIFDVLKSYYTFVFDILKLVFDTVTSILGTIWANIKITIDNIKQIISFLWNTLMSILKPIFSWIWSNIIKPVWDKISEIINNVKSAFSILVSAIKTIFGPVVDFFKNIVNTIWGLIKTIATTVGNVIGGAFKGVINGVLGAIESILNFPIKSINKLINVINKVPGINLGKLSTFKLPRLAKGGIINMPGKGVPLGIGGESGKEGVIPLTDSQQMQLLGEAIGKYITVNANITNTMNGRVISRELQKIQNENDFAFNR